MALVSLLRPAVAASLTDCRAPAAPTGWPATAQTTTPIKHVVVIFDENISFDHYFGTYPNAANTDGEPRSTRPDTPKVNGLTSAAC